MDATREELQDTMAAVRLSEMEINDLTMELSDNGSDSELFCFRSHELVEVTKSSKDLRHSVTAVLEVEVEVDLGYRMRRWSLLELLSFFCPCTAFDIVLIYTFELFPTSVRNSVALLVAEGRKNAFLS
ncbi:hypothetical protein SASPL_148528 [Salvia splendens]|uniref:Hs1pro-1 C-terminal domain-containing protein n=1 Tax=Salvia splendens TaxID=180675 RepID=A0A8X8WAB3_SALSN|nr:hypothetical protein SASPL_148528 [Salvia splendens]